MKFHLPSLRKYPIFDLDPAANRPRFGSGVPKRLLLLVGAACLVSNAWQAKGAPTPTPSPSTAATASPAATPDPASEVRNYSGTQQSEYIKTADDAYLAERSAKSGAFIAANNAYLEAGGASGKGLTSKEAIVARREMIQKALQTNSDYLAFVSTQETFYHDELAKTPLIKADVDGLTENFAEHAKTPEVKKLHETTGDMLKTGDKMMEFLQNKYGAWRLSDNKPLFKKASDVNAFSALGKKYNVDVESVQKMAAIINAPLPTPGALPDASVSPSSSGAAQPPATVSSPPASPAPGAKTQP